MLDLGRHLRINLAMDDPIPFQLSQMGREHLLCRLGHQPP